VFRWLSMPYIEGAGFLISDVTSLGFLNSIITLSLSLIFAVAGFYTLPKKENKRLSTRLFAVALIMLGLHFVIFILCSAITNAWKWIPLTEIWPIVLLGLGSNMLRGEI
jgi:heme O synthase-like polyprenyltransferase